jgi:hypothetical protein
MDRSRLRAGDADRRKVADALQQHYVEGRLSADELAERTRQAMAARTQGDLDALQHDLPPLVPTPPEHAAVASHHERPKPIESVGHRDVRMHVTSYVLMMLLLVAIWLFTTPGGYFWPIWPMLGWGVAVAMHAVARRPHGW